MINSFIMFTSNFVNPLMAFASGISYLKYKNVDVVIDPIIIMQPRREYIDPIHQNKTEYTESYIFGKTVDDVPDLPSVLKLFRNFDNNFEMLQDININDYRKPLIKSIIEYSEKLKDNKTVFFSVFRYHFLFHLFLAFLIKKISPHTKIVFGGPQIQFSKLTRELLLECNFIDHIIVGDVETGLYDYFKNKINSKIYYPNNLDLSELQMPIYNKNIFLFDKQIMLHTSRNCFNKCSYCPSVSLEYRKMPLSKFDEWMKHYNKLSYIKSFYLTDAILNPTTKRFHEIIEIMLKHNKNKNYYLWCHSNGLDEYTIKMLSKLSFEKPGCLVIAYDIASTTLQKKCDRPISIEMDKIIEWCNKYNIRTMIPFIVGLPNETNDDYQLMAEKIKLIKSKTKKSYIYPVIFSYLYIPGSPLFETPANYGISFINWDENTSKIYPPLKSLVENTPRYYNGLDPKLFIQRVEYIRNILNE